MKKINYVNYFTWSFLVLCLFLSSTAFAASSGIEGMLVDVTDYISSTLIPAAGILGVGIGGTMYAVGSPRGFDVVKYSAIGAIIGKGGIETVQALFF